MSKSDSATLSPKPLSDESKPSDSTSPSLPKSGSIDLCFKSDCFEVQTVVGRRFLQQSKSPEQYVVSILRENIQRVEDYASVSEKTEITAQIRCGENSPDLAPFELSATWTLDYGGHTMNMTREIASALVILNLLHR